MMCSMRLALFCVVCQVAAFAADTPKVMTVVLDFRGPHSRPSVEAMKREVETVLRDTGLSFAWPTAADAARDSYANLVVARFNGRCQLEPVPYLYDERGPLAFTYSTDGVVQPFTEVACDRVAASLRPAMAGGDFSRADQLFGRALGRVLAHELVHMLAGDKVHGHTGVAQPALSGARLLEPELRLSPADVERLKR
jgi:hypothetical protein